MRRFTMVDLLLLVMIVALLAIVARPAFAEDGKNVPDMIADVLSGRQDSCPTNLSGAFLIEKQVKGIPLLNMIPILNLSRMQAGVKGLTPMGEMFGKEGEFEIQTKFIWNLD